MTGKHKSAVSIFNTHIDAEHAIRKLQKYGFDMKKLSIAGRDCHSKNGAMGFYREGNQFRFFGKPGALWETVLEIVDSSAFFIIPGLGPVFIGGPLVRWIISALESAAPLEGLSAIGEVFYNIGIPRGNIPEYEMSVKSNKFLLVAHGVAVEVERARKALEKTKASDTTFHNN